MVSELKALTLYKDTDLEISKEAAWPEFLYLTQDGFEHTDVVELTPAQQRTLYGILKNRFEA
jgi:hypothetical protein